MSSQNSYPDCYIDVNENVEEPDPRTDFYWGSGSGGRLHHFLRESQPLDAFLSCLARKNQIASIVNDMENIRHFKTDKDLANAIEYDGWWNLLQYGFYEIQTDKGDKGSMEIEYNLRTNTTIRQSIKKLDQKDQLEWEEVQYWNFIHEDSAAACLDRIRKQSIDLKLNPSAKYIKEVLFAQEDVEWAENILSKRQLQKRKSDTVLSKHKRASQSRNRNRNRNKSRSKGRHY